MKLDYYKSQIKEKFINFSLATTCHGYPNIFKTDILVVKVIWVVCCLASASSCIWMIARSVEIYLEFGVTTTIRVVDQTPMTFPTVTVCTTNPFQTAFAEKYLEQTFIEYFNTSITSYNQKFIKNGEELDLNEAVKRVKSIALKNIITGNNSKEIQRNLGYSPRDLFEIKFQFNDQQLSLSDLSISFNNQFGNCFIFNSGYNQKGEWIGLKSSYLSGYTYGLVFYMYTPVSKSPYNLELYSGIKVFLHNHTVKPLNSEGIFLKSGMTHLIGLRKTISKKLPNPYSECEAENSKLYESSIIYKEILKQNSTYRQKECFELCLDKEIIDQCGCYMIENGESFDKKPCTSPREQNCSSRVSNQLKLIDVKNLCYKHCPLECEFTNYQLTMSSSNYPTRLFSDFILETKNRTILNNTVSTHEEVRENLVSVLIYFDELKYTFISESESITSTALISNIGGTLGLFMGMSLLSFIEIIELLIEIFFLYLNFPYKTHDTEK